MLYEANEGTFCPIKYSVRASEVCSSTQLIFSHSLKQTIILTFDKLCINLDGQSINNGHSLRENVNLSQSLDKLIQDCIICIIMYLSLTNQNT